MPITSNLPDVRTDAGAASPDRVSGARLRLAGSSPSRDLLLVVRYRCDHSRRRGRRRQLPLALAPAPGWLSSARSQLLCPEVSPHHRGCYATGVCSIAPMIQTGKRTLTVLFSGPYIAPRRTLRRCYAARARSISPGEAATRVLCGNRSQHITQKRSPDESDNPFNFNRLAPETLAAERVLYCSLLPHSTTSRRFTADLECSAAYPRN